MEPQTVVNQQAYEVEQLAMTLVEGSFAYSAAMSIANNERADDLAPKIEPGQLVPIGRIKHMAGGEHLYHLSYYLKWPKTEKIVKDEFERIWFAGSLLSLGDLLSQNRYFNRAPELELIRHLRNGIAHGNKFRIDKPESLKKYPAHNKDAWVKHHAMTFEINEKLNDQKVLFDFMYPGDLVDLFRAVGIYLTRMGLGETLRRVT